MAESIVCTKCGSAVPDRRNRCGRCGSTAVAAVATPAVAPSKNRTGLIVAGASVVVICAIAFPAMSGRRAPSAASVSASSKAASSATADLDNHAQRADNAQLVEPITADDHSRAGISAYNGGDLESATTQLKSAVDADPDNAEALNNLGQVLVRGGKARDAIGYFDRAIALAGDKWAYRFNRARAFGELKEWNQAAIGYADAARLFPDDYVTQFNLARARQQNGDLTGALEAYDKAAKLAPGQADFQLWYGQALDQSGRQQDAVAAYKKFLELEPAAPQAEKVKARLAQLGASVEETPARTS